MNIQTPIQFMVLSEEVESQINSFKTKRDKNRVSTGNSVLALGISTGITTIFVGISGIVSEWHIFFSVCALITSSVASFLSFVEAKFDNRGLWALYAETLSELYAISFELRNISGTDFETSPETLESINNKFQKVLQNTNTKWVAKRSEEV